jgi:hypothetical protein
MPGPENKNHYSHDEMMDRLREARSGSRSSDGNKRKRRSHQPTIEKRKKLQKLVIVAAGLCLLALAVPVTMYMIARGGYETEAFRLSVSNRVATMVQKEAVFGRFELNGSSLTSQQLELTDRNEAGYLQKARFTGLRADLKSNFHFGTEWPVSKVVVDQAQIELARRSGEGPREYPPAPSSLKKSKFGLSPAPSAIVIDEIFFRDFNLAWGQQGKEDTIQNAQMQATIVGNLVSWQLIDGKLDFGSIPTLSVANLAGEFSNNELRIEAGRIGYSKGQEGTITGIVDLNDKGSADLDLALSGIELNSWLDEQWQQRIQNGDLKINAKYTSSFQKGVPSKMTGDFEVSGLSMRNLHLFECMHLVFNETHMNLLKFERIEGQFAWTPGRLILTHLFGEHTGVLKLAGDLSIFETAQGEGPVIDGVLQLGVPSVRLREFPEGPPSFLSEPKNGYVWMTIKISGPFAEPVHDFLDKLDQKLRDRLPLAPWEFNQGGNAPPSVEDLSFPDE